MNTAARYISTFMMMSIYGSFGCILSWVSTSLPRPASKRAVAYAVVNAGSNFASIYASYFYPSSQGPKYWQANVANVAFSCMCILMATLLHFVLRHRNRRLDKATEADVAAGRDYTVEGSESYQLAHKWDCHPNYRYTTCVVSPVEQWKTDEVSCSESAPSTSDPMSKIRYQSGIADNPNLPDR
jgi:hypothetical protein